MQTSIATGCFWGPAGPTKPCILIHNIMKLPACITMFFFLLPQSFSAWHTRRRRADALRRRFPRVSISPRLSERSILVHLRMLLRLDYPQHSVFANGLHVVASIAPIVRWLRERHRDCCTLEFFDVNLESTDTSTSVAVHMPSPVCRYVRRQEVLVACP